MKIANKSKAVVALLCAAFTIVTSLPGHAARHTRKHVKYPRSAVARTQSGRNGSRRILRPAHVPPVAKTPTLSPLWPQYDEIKQVVEGHVMSTGPYFDPAAPLTAGAMIDTIGRIRAEYIHHGLPLTASLPTVANRAQPLTRAEAVDLLVKAILPPAETSTWSPNALSNAVLDIADVLPADQHSVALAAEHMFIPNPLRPQDAADRAFGASIAARALPWDNVPPASGPMADDIRKAISMHLLYSAGPFAESAPITTAQLARAVARARMYVPSELWPELPDPPVASTDAHPLTRAEVISMVVSSLVADNRFNTRLANLGTPIEDPDARVAFALGPQMYLSSLDDAADIPSINRPAIAVATYKGWLPNLATEPGKLMPNEQATMGYVATLLARAVHRPGDYTGIVIDMSGLKPIGRAGGMWVLNAGKSAAAELPAEQIYPASGHAPVRPFFSAPGALAYYGDVGSASRGRAGFNPLVIHALDWAQYDWTSLNGEPGLRRGGGVNVPLTTFHFVHGTPPLILVSPDDARKMQDLDHSSLLLRTARVALVQPNWSMTAMR